MPSQWSAGLRRAAFTYMSYPGPHPVQQQFNSLMPAGRMDVTALARTLIKPVPAHRTADITVVRAGGQTRVAVAHGGT